MHFDIKRGLDLPLSGEPEQVIEEAPRAASVALLSADYPGSRPRLLVREGETVRLGQALFVDRRFPEIRFTSPGAGVVAEIHRGERRSLTSLIVHLSGGEEERFPSWSPARLSTLTRAEVCETLLRSGLWTALRTRPFSAVPRPGDEPHSLFVTAIDSHPLAPLPEVVIEERREDFAHGLDVVARLTDGPVFLCKRPEAQIPEGAPGRVRVATFAGPHPAGIVGTHIHLLDPVAQGKSVWHVGYQDVIAIGKLFTTGRLAVERVVALGGPAVQRPRLVRTRLGAGLEELMRSELRDGPCRVLSGSALAGRIAAGPTNWLGRYHQQICALPERPRRSFLDRLVGRNSYSVHRLPFPVITRRRRALEAASNERTPAMLPLPSFERVLPLDILPTPLLRALLVGDADMARTLGCLELDEEDLALCSFVCAGKQDYGTRLRAVLGEIAREE